MFRALAEDADFDYAMVDGSIVKVTATDRAQKGDSGPGHRRPAREVATGVQAHPQDRVAGLE
jgi:hypothetical protein